MMPPCLVVNETMLPALRIRLARGLMERGRSQTEIAMDLRVTQGMVSRYRHMPLPIGHEQTIAGHLATDLLKMVDQGADDAALVSEICGQCSVHKSVGGYCGVCAIPDCNNCMTLPFRHAGHWQVIGEMRKALRGLANGDISALVPQVQMNLACMVPEATSPFQVASIPGRIRVHSGRVLPDQQPEFGASQHLAGLLLEIHDRIPAITTILNIRHDLRFIADLNQEHEVGMIGREQEREQDREQEREQDREQGPGWSSKELGSRVNLPAGALTLIDPGAFGIEPMIYLLGESPGAVVDRAISILGWSA